MNADRLRHSLILQRQELTLDEFGQMNGQWMDVSPEWASIEGTSSWPPVPSMPKLPTASPFATLTR